MKFKLILSLFLALFTCCTTALAEPTNATEKKIEWCRLQHPGTITIEAGTRSELIYGQVFIPNCSEGEKVCKGVKAEVCIAPKDNTKSMTCFVAQNNPKFRTDTNNDEYMAEIYTVIPGEYYLLYQFSLDNGRTYIKCDFDDDAGFDFAKAGTAIVKPKETKE